MDIGRKYWLILLFVASGTVSYLKAEGKPDFASVDSISYRLYLEKDWRVLKIFCDGAIRNGYDYYYLRVRAGIACFERKQYREAIVHFEKSLSFSANDPLANEYLYFSYVYAGYYDQARKLSKSFDPAFAEYMGTNQLSPIEFISGEGGVKLSDTSVRFGTASYGQLGLKHYIGRGVSLFHAITYYEQQEFRFRVQQFQYYVNASLPMKHGFTLSAAFHGLYAKAAVNSYTLDLSQAPLQVYRVDTIITNRSIFSYVGSLNLTKQTRSFDLSLGVTVSSFDTVVQAQLNGNVSYYPFKNNRLAIGSSAYLHTIDMAIGRYYLALAPYVSANFTKKLSGCLGYFTNKGVNISEMNGYLVNNSTDFTTERYTASLSYALFKKMYIYTVCGRENKKELARSYKYNYNIFLLGIKFVPS